MTESDPTLLFLAMVEIFDNHPAASQLAPPSPQRYDDASLTDQQRAPYAVAVAAFWHLEECLRRRCAANNERCWIDACDVVTKIFSCKWIAATFHGNRLVVKRAIVPCVGSCFSVFCDVAQELLTQHPESCLNESNLCRALASVLHAVRQSSTLEPWHERSILQLFVGTSPTAKSYFADLMNAANHELPGPVADLVHAILIAPVEFRRGQPRSFQERTQVTLWLNLTRALLEPASAIVLGQFLVDIPESLTVPGRPTLLDAAFAVALLTVEEIMFLSSSDERLKDRWSFILPDFVRLALLLMTKSRAPPGTQPRKLSSRTASALSQMYDSLIMTNCIFGFLDADQADKDQENLFNDIKTAFRENDGDYKQQFVEALSVEARAHLFGTAAAVNQDDDK